MKRIPFIILLLTFTGFAVFGDSLWDEGYKGLLSEKSTLKPGQVIKVLIDEETSFKYVSSSTGNKKVTLELTGGESDGLFSFLPSGGSSEALNKKGNEDLRVKASIAVRVVEVDQAGMCRITGTKTITIAGGEESISIDGWINPADVSESMSIPLNNVADFHLFFSSLIEPSMANVSAADLISKEPPESGYSLNDAKKMELLLSYLNRFLDLVFQQSR